MNSYYSAHNPDVYEDPFKVKPDRFLDEDGKVVDPGHPLRTRLAIHCYLYYLCLVCIVFSVYFVCRAQCNVDALPMLAKVSKWRKGLKRFQQWLCYL